MRVYTVHTTCINACNGRGKLEIKTENEKPENENYYEFVGRVRIIVISYSYYEYVEPDAEMQHIRMTRDMAYSYVPILERAGANSLE